MLIVQRQEEGSEGGGSGGWERRRKGGVLRAVACMHWTSPRQAATALPSQPCFRYLPVDWRWKESAVGRGRAASGGLAAALAGGVPSAAVTWPRRLARVARLAVAAAALPCPAPPPTLPSGLVACRGVPQTSGAWLACAAAGDSSARMSVVRLPGGFGPLSAAACAALPSAVVGMSSRFVARGRVQTWATVQCASQAQRGQQPTRARALGIWNCGGAPHASMQSLLIRILAFASGSDHRQVIRPLLERWADPAPCICITCGGGQSNRGSCVVGCWVIRADVAAAGRTAAHKAHELQLGPGCAHSTAPGPRRARAGHFAALGAQDAGRKTPSVAGK